MEGAGRREERVWSGPTHLVCKDHEAIVGLAADGAADTLSAVPQRVKGKEVILLDTELLTQVLEARLVGPPPPPAHAMSADQDEKGDRGQRHP